MPFKLDNRLFACGQLVRKNSKIADIGTDHAYLPVWLCKNGIAKSALACDIGQEPLQNGINTIEKYHAENLVKTRLCNGLSEIEKDDADDIIIAGMGGETIAEIIGNWKYSRDKDKRFILQPMTRANELIEFLYSNGFEILKQECCKERKIYTVILVAYTGATKEVSKEFSYLGKLNPKTKPLDREFLEMELRDIKNKSNGDESYKQVFENLKKECGMNDFN